MKAHPTRRLGKISEARVAELVEQMGHSWRDSGKDSIGIDGFIEVVRGGELTGLLIGVQIKAGRSYLTTKKETDHLSKRLPPDRRFVRIRTNHLEYFKTCAFPVVVAFYDENSRNTFWGSVAMDASTALPVPNIFDQFSARKIARVADHWHQDYPKHADPRAPGVTIAVAKSAVQRFYRQLRTTGVHSPAYGNVEFTLRGWRHMTRQHKERDKVVRSLDLLGAAVKILSEEPSIHLCRKADNGHRLYRQTARVTHPHRADAIVSVICEKIDDARPYQFLSVYEHGDRRVRVPKKSKKTKPARRKAAKKKVGGR